MSTLITGGIKSGKSSYALKIAKKYEKKLFIATAEAFDDTMKVKIKRHQKERKDYNFTLIEEPINIHKEIIENKNKFEIILIDCLTLWLNNLIFYKKDINKYFDLLSNALKNTKNVILVTNEVGMGIAPSNTLSLNFLDNLGILNQIVANIVDNVILMSCGIPLKIKEGGNIYD